MDFDEIKDQLKEFNYYKQLILHGEAGKRNTIIERKDGSCAIIHHETKQKPIPGLASDISDIERITVFIDGQEYEFVACQ